MKLNELHRQILLGLQVLGPTESSELIDGCLHITHNRSAILNHIHELLGQNVIGFYKDGEKEIFHMYGQRPKYRNINEPWGVSQDEPPGLFLDVNLDLYHHQFVQNETCSGCSTHAQPNKTTFLLSHTPILPGSITGTIYRKTHITTAIETFKALIDGTLAFTTVRQPPGTPRQTSLYVRQGSICHTTGEIELTWSEATEHISIVVNYEYSLESNNPDFYDRLKKGKFVI